MAATRPSTRRFVAQIGDVQLDAGSRPSRAATRVYIVDPLPVAREGYAAILGGRPGIRVAGKAATIEDAEAELALVAVDVVVLDTRLPRATWTDACARVRTAARGAGILLVLPVVDRRVLAEAHTIGVKGTLLRTASPMTIRRAVRALAAGQSFFETAITRRRDTEQLRAPFGLTPQQTRVVELLARGLTNRGIGLELGISEHTVKTHLTQIMRKLHARDRAHAAVIALREGLI